jgi:hypothetical protein
MPNKKIHIFWDNSNIFVGGKSVASQKDGVGSIGGLRIDFESLIKLASAGRPIESAFAVGSIPPELMDVWGRLKKTSTGVKIKLFERGANSNKEQAVDEVLQLEMLRRLNDCEPGVAIMLTGDGKGFTDGAGFHADLERMQKKGWNIELLSWDLCCNKRFKEWARSVGHFIPLEQYYESITFVKDGRTKRPLNLTHRPISKG